MKILLACSLIALAAGAPETGSQGGSCRERSSQKPWDPHHSRARCPREMEAGGIVLLSKAYALSKAIFKHEGSELDRSQGSQGRAEDGHSLVSHLSSRIGSLAKSTAHLLSTPESLLSLWGPRSSGVLWLLLMLVIVMIGGGLVWMLRQRQQQNQIYEDQIYEEDGWKHESWVRGRNQRNSDGFDDARFLQAQLARGERPTYHYSTGDQYYQDAWTRDAPAASSTNVPAEVPQAPRSQWAPTGVVEGGVVQAVRGVEHGGQQVVGLVQHTGGAAMHVGSGVLGTGKKLVKTIDKNVTGKALKHAVSSVEDAASSAATRVKMRWDEARAANS